jgi:hypothetical protein
MADERSGELTTANYGWVKPNVGDSDDAWGGMLNADLDGIDTTVKSVSTVANAAYPASNPSGYQTAANVTASLGSYLALSGGIMTGAMTLAADPTANLQPATKQYVDNKPLNDNRIINGNFAVNQRGQVSGTALAAAAYGHDRWKAGTGGCTYTFTAALPDTTITITAGTLTQVVEAGMIEGGVYTLSWTGTAQARVYQGAPSGAYAASPVITASLPAGTNTIVEFNTGTVVRVKLEIGSVATPYNRQSLAKSQADCERYFRWVGFNMSFNAAGAVTMRTTVPLSPAMRATPTMSANAVDPNTTPASGNESGDAQVATSPYSVYHTMTAVAAGQSTLQGYRASASAEL